MESKIMDVKDNLSTNERNILDSDGTTAKVRFNNSLIIAVDKQKLMEKSLYFQASRKKCYKDHESEFLEVNYSVNNEIFKRVMNFIVSGNIDLDNDVLFECLSLANYLQIDGLQKPCLDYFAYQLKVTNVNEKLELLESSHIIDKVFKETAMAFKASGLPSYSGMYFLDLKDNYTAHLKMFYEGSESVHDISFLSPMLCDVLDAEKIKNYSDSEFLNSESSESESSYSGPRYQLEITDLLVQHVHNTVVIFVQNDSRSIKKNCFLELNLKTGKILQTTPVSISKSRTIFSTGDESLFVIRSVDDEVENFSKTSSFLLSVFEENNEQNLKECKTKLFNFSNEEKVANLECIHLDFVQYDNEKCYMFYRDDYEGGMKYGNLYVMVICVKTLSILKNIKLELGQNEHKLSKFRYIKKLFYMKKAQKLFIEIYFEFGFQKSILVFDTKSEKHYFTKGLLPIMLSFGYSTHADRRGQGYIKYSTKEDVLYAICRRTKLDESVKRTPLVGRIRRGQPDDLHQCWIEVSTWRYENEKFVEAGTKWKSSVEKLFVKTHLYPEIFSAVFV